MELLQAYPIVRQRLFEATVERYFSEIDKGFPIMGLCAQADVEYARQLGTHQSNTLYRAICRRVILAYNRSRETEIPISFWLSKGGTEEELNVYKKWCQSYRGYTTRWLESQSAPAITSRELYRLLLPAFRQSLGSKGDAFGLQCVFDNTCNGWSINVSFSCSSGFSGLTRQRVSAVVSIRIWRPDDIKNPTCHPETLTNGMWPWIPIPFPAPDFYLEGSTAQGASRLVQAVRATLEPLVAELPELAKGIGPDD